MKKIVYVEPYKNTGMYIEYQIYRRPEGGTDQEGEWHFSHYSHHRDFRIKTKSGDTLKTFKIPCRYPPYQKNKRNDLAVISTRSRKFYSYHETLFHAVEWLLICIDLVYRKDFVVSCNKLGWRADDCHKEFCPFLKVNKDGKTVECEILPSTGGYSMGTNEGRPLPKDMICDLKYIYHMFGYEFDARGFSLKHYWMVQTGEMKELIEKEIQGEQQ